MTKSICCINFDAGQNTPGRQPSHPVDSRQAPTRGQTPVPADNTSNWQNPKRTILLKTKNLKRLLPMTNRFVVKLLMWAGKFSNYFDYFYSQKKFPFITKSIVTISKTSFT